MKKPAFACPLCRDRGYVCVAYPRVEFIPGVGLVGANVEITCPMCEGECAWERMGRGRQ